MTNGEQKRKLKFLFVSIDGLIGDLAAAVKKEGHEVRYFIEKDDQKDVCDGFVDKTDSWKDQTDWADVVVFDDVGFGADADALRKEGKLVVGGSLYTDNLELDREFGQAEMKAGDIPIIPRWNFTSFDDAIEFMKKTPDRYVIKPSGLAQNEKELLFVGQEDDGRDIIEMLQRYKKNWAKQIKVFQIQKFISGVEVATGAFFNGEDFIYPINVNFEHKRMFPGEIGPSTGEMGTLMFWSNRSPIFDVTLARMKEKLAASGYVGYIDINCIANSRGIYPLEFTCYDDETEILTKEGWKRFEAVRQGEEVAALNPKSQCLEYQKVRATIKKRYKGRMVRINNKDAKHSSIDIRVTPDHQMYIKRTYKKKWEFIRADQLGSGHAKIKRSAGWNGKRMTAITIPGYVEKHSLGKHKKYIDLVHTPRKVHAGAFVKFLGLFISEGSAKPDGQIIISQSENSRWRQEIRDCLLDFGFEFQENKRGFQMGSVQLVSFLKSIGLFGKTAHEKFIPTVFKDLSRDLLQELLRGLVIGDGNIREDKKEMTYFTTSEKLSDDVQEIVLKCGYSSNIHKRLSKNTRMEFMGKTYVRNHDGYVVKIRRTKIDAYLEKGQIHEEDYDGFVYCVEVPNHIVYVRRNGKAAWCGNCRFGYPHISIAMEGVLSEWGYFLEGIAKKQKPELRTKRGFQVGVVVAVPPFPFEDPRAFKRYSEGATIIFKKPAYEGMHIGDVKVVENDWRLAGNSGYALIVTGSGTTVDETRSMAYNRIRNIIIPNMFYRTDIGERWARDSDKLLMWGYL
jgi:phosphoribosylamine-glycine ligase